MIVYCPPDEEPDPIKAYEATAGKVWKAIIIPATTKLQLIVNLSNGKKISQPLAEMTLKSGAGSGAGLVAAGGMFPGLGCLCERVADVGLAHFAECR